MNKIVIAGTDTNIGKTICSALLMSVLKGTYFKPIQSGSKEDNDTNTVKQLSELGDEHFLREKYLLKEPLSPHLAAEIDGVVIDRRNLLLPSEFDFEPLIIELAGGLMVPVNRNTLFVDIVKDWNAKVILCARTGLGTINHILLSIESLKTRNIEIAGIVFIGEENADNIKTTLAFSNTRFLGYIPILKEINNETLVETFNKNFDRSYFEENYGI